MTPSAKKFLKSWPPRRWPRAYANSIPTTRWPSSRTCRRRSRPKFSSSSRRPSEWCWRAACSTRKTPPAGVCRPSSRPPVWTVGRTIDYLRETPDLPERFWEIYVVDSTGRLQGTVALDRLLRTKRPVPIAELIDEELHPVRVTDDQEDVARLFEHYDLVATPVVDEA